MSGTSNVGQGSVYEAGDQRPHPPKNADNMDEFAKKFAAGNTANIHNKDDPSTLPKPTTLLLALLPLFLPSSLSPALHPLTFPHSSIHNTHNHSHHIN